MYFVRGGSNFWLHGHDETFGVIHNKIKLVVSGDQFAEHESLTIINEIV